MRFCGRASRVRFCFVYNRLPAFGSRLSFKGAYYVAGDPAAVKPACLCFCYFAVDEAGVHQLRIERDVIPDRFESFRRVGVIPGRVFVHFPADLDVIITGIAFPRAVGVIVTGPEVFFMN